MKVEFIGIDRIDNMPITEKHNYITIADYYGEGGVYNMSGELRGYQKDFIIHTKGYEKKEVPFTINKNEASKRFEVCVSGIDWMKTTDFGLQIVDKEGNEISSAGLNQKDGSIIVNNKFDAESTDLILKVSPGFVSEDMEADVYITDVTDFKSIKPVTVKNNNRTSIKLYPSVEEELTCEFAKPAEVIPEGAKPYGKIYLKSLSTDETEFETPVFFKF